jgi:multisubunit Na+/H+ antiporter MnhF subunit
MDTINLVLIALVLLALLILSRPKLFERLSLVEILGIKLQLNRALEAQAQQQTQLQDINLILPLLIPESERKHLAELGNNKKNLYQGSSSLVQELRRLRSIGLVTGLGIHRLEHMRDFYLGNYVKLTEFGKLWLDRINEIEKPQKSNQASQD